MSKEYKLMEEIQEIQNKFGETLKHFKKLNKQQVHFATVSCDNKAQHSSYTKYRVENT